MAEEESHPAEKWSMWAALAVALVGAAWAYTAGDNPEAGWQYAGGVLELSGFALVITDLELRLERFGDRPGPFLRAGRWIGDKARHIARRFGWKRHHILKVDGLSHGVSFGDSVTVDVTRAAPFPGVRGEIVRLERMIGDLESKIERVESEAADEREKLEDRLREEIAALRGEVEDVKATVRETVAAGFGLELMGVVLFAAGVVLGTWGPAIF